MLLNRGRGYESNLEDVGFFGVLVDVDLGERGYQDLKFRLEALLRFALEDEKQCHSYLIIHDFENRQVPVST